MTDANTENASGTTVQAPKAASELTWVDKAHGAESVMTIAALIIGALWAVFGDWKKTKVERASERDLRERERQQRLDQVLQERQRLAWQQTQTAREVNEQFLDDSEAQQALTLVDCENDTCTLTEYSATAAVKLHQYDLKAKEDVRALRVRGEPPNEKEAFLRKSFDAWFYWMAVLEQYLRNGLIRQQDIAFPSDYYLRQLRDDTDLHEACIVYATHHGLSPNVLAFMRRFEAADT